MTAETRRPRFPRKAPQTGRLYAERALFEEMEFAAEQLHSEQDYGRAGVLRAVRACHDSLHVRGLSGQGLKPLTDLMSALEAVCKGTLPELFDPRAKAAEQPSRKWSRSPAAKETKIYASACMDALMTSGKGKQEAAKEVARAAQNWPKVSSGIIKNSTVTNWRDELRQQLSDDRDRVMFERLSQTFSKGPKARGYLTEVLRDGPPMTGAIRNTKT